MKSKLYIILAAALSALSLGSCSEDDTTTYVEPETTQLSLDLTEITATVGGGSYTIEVTSNSDWTALVKDAAENRWCSVSPSAGSGNGTITVTVDENTTTRELSAVIEVTSRELQERVEFTQIAIEETLSVSTPEIDATVAEGFYIVEIESNTAWTIEPQTEWPGEWFEVSRLSGTGNDAIRVTVGENTSFDEFTATLKVCARTVEKEIILIQSGKDAIVAAIPEVVLAAIPAASYIISVRSNAPWTAEIENATDNTWCAVTPSSGEGDGTITLILAKNRSIQPKSANVIIKAARGGDVSAVIPIEQRHITWAATNLDGEKTFAANPGMVGTFFQFGRTKAWPATGDVEDWEETYPAGNWDMIGSNPCPDGWRLPSYEDITDLVATSPRVSPYNVGRWTTENFGNGAITGKWLGPNANEATVDNPGDALFFPVTGYRYAWGGYLYWEESEGHYWTTEQSTTYKSLAWAMNFMRNSCGPSETGGKSDGKMVRCVKY